MKKMEFEKSKDTMLAGILKSLANCWPFKQGSEDIDETIPYRLNKDFEKSNPPHKNKKK